MHQTRLQVNVLKLEPSLTSFKKKTKQKKRKPSLTRKTPPPQSSRAAIVHAGSDAVFHAAAGSREPQPQSEAEAEAQDENSAPLRPKS
jgi:hypothetical protein